VSEIYSDTLLVINYPNYVALSVMSKDFFQALPPLPGNPRLLSKEECCQTVQIFLQYFDPVIYIGYPRRRHVNQDSHPKMLLVGRNGALHCFTAEFTTSFKPHFCTQTAIIGNQMHMKPEARWICNNDVATRIRDGNGTFEQLLSLGCRSSLLPYISFVNLSKASTQFQHYSVVEQHLNVRFKQDASFDISDLQKILFGTIMRNPENVPLSTEKDSPPPAVIIDSNVGPVTEEKLRYALNNAHSFEKYCEFSDDIRFHLQGLGIDWDKDESGTPQLFISAMGYETLGFLDDESVREKYCNSPFLFKDNKPRAKL